MIIDGHSHVVLPVEKHISLMDEASIDKTILFSTPIHPEKAADMAHLKSEMSVLNEIITGKRNAAEAGLQSMEELGSVINQYPTRFVGFGRVPVRLSYDDTASYIEKNVKNAGYVGLGEFTLGSGQVNLLDVIFKASVSSGNLPLWIHAFNPLTLNDIQDIAALAIEYPSVPVIIGHMGGSSWLETIELVKQIPNLFMDLSAYFSALVLKMAILELPYKCIFGVDLPYGDLLLARQGIERVCTDKYVRSRVLGENIREILKI